MNLYTVLEVIKMLIRPLSIAILFLGMKIDLSELKIYKNFRKTFYLSSFAIIDMVPL